MKETVSKIPTIKQLDKLWAKACRIRDGEKCVYTFEIYHTTITRDQSVLQAHHIFEKQTHRLRWELDNGITVTKGVHFSVAHANSPTPRNQFRQWALGRLPKARRDKLELLERVKKSGGVDKFAVKLYLEREIADFKLKNLMQNDGWSA